ncbi:MAG: hypothetical protein IKW28_11075 [Lachnospiraceae bacterium]|nr:hypothetical protein [Lachnospiraceae bacterium]
MRIKKLVSNIIIVVLSFFLVTGIIFLISEIGSYGTDYYEKEEPFLYAIQGKDYPRLLEISYYNRVVDQEKSDKYSEYHGIADYFEAASYYRAYKENKEKEKEERMKRQMEEAKERMGDYSYLQEEIHEILGIDEIK